MVFFSWWLHEPMTVDEKKTFWFVKTSRAQVEDVVVSPRATEDAEIKKPLPRRNTYAMCLEMQNKDPRVRTPLSCQQPPSWEADTRSRGMMWYFIAPKTNDKTKKWYPSFSSRARLYPHWNLSRLNKVGCMWINVMICTGEEGEVIVVVMFQSNRSSRPHRAVDTRKSLEEPSPQEKMIAI